MQPDQKLENNNQLSHTQQLAILNKFIEKEKPNLTKDVLKSSIEEIKAQIFPPSQQYLPLAGELIRKEKLVAFPTQTVYGLGADATCEKALLDIYKVKRRPLTDPIIVHVLNYEDGLKLVDMKSEEEKQLFKVLTQKFWPGPLTIILKANLQILPKVVTAQTGFVGIRSPKCEYARKLLKESKRPIGAPSANLFSHVSPTSASHVFNDFYDQSITIVDGQRCEYGIQSTVIKVVGNRIQILREGSLSKSKLSSFVSERFHDKVQIQVVKKVQGKKSTQNMEAPGQMLKHYAPYLPCFYTTNTNLQNFSFVETLENEAKISMNQSAIISFSERFDIYKNKFKEYFKVKGQNLEDKEELQEEDKFCTPEEKEKMREVYHLLRKCENLEIKCIIIGWDESKSGTIWDKIYRSTQGNEAKFV